INQDLNVKLVSIAKELVFPDRTYSKIISIALKEGVASNDISRLRYWLISHSIDQKQLDAISLLSRMSELHQKHHSATPISFRTETTEFWERLRRTAGTMEDVALYEDGGQAHGLFTCQFDDVLNELKIIPKVYQKIKLDTVFRFLASKEYL